MMIKKWNKIRPEWVASILKRCVHQKYSVYFENIWIEYFDLNDEENDRNESIFNPIAFFVVKGIYLEPRSVGCDTIEDPLKIMIFFYFMLRALFVLKIFIFFSWLFAYLEIWLDKKAMVNFKIYYITDWTKNNYNLHITQYLKK